MSPGLFSKEDLCNAAFAALDADQDGLITVSDLEKIISGDNSATVAAAVLAEIGAQAGCDRARFDALVRGAAASGSGA